MTDSKPPQTFEEWDAQASWRRIPTSQDVRREYWDRGYAAGVASQQAATQQWIDRTPGLEALLQQARAQLAAKDAEIKRQARTIIKDTAELIRLRARYEAVVEAARKVREYQRGLVEDDIAGHGPGGSFTEREACEIALDAALAKLEEK